MLPAESRATGTLLLLCQLDGPGCGEWLGQWNSGTQLLFVVLSWASLDFSWASLASSNKGCLRAKPDCKRLVHQHVYTSSWVFRRWSEPCKISSLPLWEKKIVF